MICWRPTRDYLSQRCISLKELGLLVGAKNTRETFLALRTARSIG